MGGETVLICIGAVAVFNYAPYFFPVTVEERHHLLELAKGSVSAEAEARKILGKSLLYFQYESARRRIADAKGKDEIQAFMAKTNETDAKPIECSTGLAHTRKSIMS